MNITITSADKGDYILIISVGVVAGKDDLIKHAELIYREIIKYDNQKILLDDIDTRFPLDKFSYYEQVQSFIKNFPPEIRLLKIAVVLSPEFEEGGKFWETLAVNRGFEYHSFTSIEEARSWLIQ